MPPTNAISAAGVGPDSCVISQADSDSAFLGGSFSGGNSFLPVVSPKLGSGSADEAVPVRIRCRNIPRDKRGHDEKTSEYARKMSRTLPAKFPAQGGVTAWPKA